MCFEIVTAEAAVRGPNPAFGGQPGVQVKNFIFGGGQLLQILFTSPHSDAAFVQLAVGR
jgi:hypothetical protein